MAKKKKAIPVGTIRIRVKDCLVCEKTSKSWKKSKTKCSDALHVIKLFKAHGNLGLIIDKKDPRFFKGQISNDGKLQGARVNVLPDGRKLNWAYSLFAKHLTIHDELSNEHWDVIYQNPCGRYAYLYTVNKGKKAVKKKYKKVQEFEKCYPIIKRKVSRYLRIRDDYITLPMYTLFKTLMRIGNEMYFKAHGHKGLTTLKKKDISIRGNVVKFNYLAKGGIPMNTCEKFPEAYVKKLRKILKKKKDNDFVFVNPETNHPLKDTDFRKAFKEYCGREFYPHIVRSYFATKQAKKFLKNRNLSKEEVKEFYLSIAEKLGHKKFVKKKNQWEASYTVTVKHYIDPAVVEKINSFIK